MVMLDMPNHQIVCRIGELDVSIGKSFTLDGVDFDKKCRLKVEIIMNGTGTTLIVNRCVKN